MIESTLTLKESLQYLQNEIPGKEDAYLMLLIEGIEKLSDKPIFDSRKDIFHQLLEDRTGTWHLYFSKREIYYRSIIQIWPTYFFHQIEKQIQTTNTFDAYVKIYRLSGFGTFLSNTKTLAGLYQAILPDWDSCFEDWVIGNTRILLPYTPLSKKELEVGIRKVINQIVVDPAKYHSNLDELVTLVRRQYQLALTEQNR